MPPKPTIADPGADQERLPFSKTVLMPLAADGSGEISAENSSPVPASIPYHCVCGDIVPLCPSDGGQCAACGRRYSARVARIAATETIRMPLAREEDLAFEISTESELGDDLRSEAATPGTEIVVDPDDRPACRLPHDRKLGHFRVVGRLGRGGMGDVFRALDESLQRYVAIKLLRPIRGVDGARDEALDRLLEEARAQARVNHPGVVHIYFVSPDPEQPFLAMELVSGGSLADRMNDAPLPYAETIRIALQIASALHHAARFDVVHGDIKPGNILLSEEGEVKLGDFGLARRLSARRRSPRANLTGTPNYLAPEITEGSEPDHRGDMYALGVMLFEMTFGRRPYSVDTGSLRDALEAHRSAAVEFPEAWPLDLPEGWGDVLRRLLEKHPEDRYDTYDELIADLERLQPVEMPSAGRVSRALAWAVDLFLAGTAATLLMAPYHFLAAQGFAPDSPIIARLLTLVVGVIVMFMAAWLQSLWKTSPGKAMFQLRIVDRHGLSPSEIPLFLRAFFQLLPIWTDDFLGVVASLGVSQFGLLATGAVLAVSAVDAASAILRRDGRSIHDLLFMTRVVLDVRSGKHSK